MIELNEIFQATESNDNTIKTEFDPKLTNTNHSPLNQATNLPQSKPDLIQIKLENNNLKFENTNLKYENAMLINENANFKSTIELQSVHIEELKNQYNLLQQQFKEYVNANK